MKTKFLDCKAIIKCLGEKESLWIIHLYVCKIFRKLTFLMCVSGGNKCVSQGRGGGECQFSRKVGVLCVMQMNPQISWSEDLEIVTKGDKICKYTHFNPIVPNAPLFYPLKTSENLQGVKKGCIWNKWVKVSKSNEAIPQQ